MARQLRWVRATAELVDNGAYSNGHIVQGPVINVGETLTRVRYHWLATFDQTPPIPFLSLGFSVLFGAIVLPASATAAQVPSLVTGANQPWIAFESTATRPFLGADDKGLVAELDVAPPDYGRERDTKAQRRAESAQQRLWFRSETTTNAPTQTRHTLTMSYSVGILMSS